MSVGTHAEPLMCRRDTFDPTKFMANNKHVKQNIRRISQRTMIIWISTDSA